MTSSPDIKNRGGRPATGQGTPVMVRLQPEPLARLDLWISAQADPKPSRPEAIRRALGEWLDYALLPIENADGNEGAP